MMAMPEEVSSEEEAAEEPVDTSVADLVKMLRSEGFAVTDMRLINISQVRTQPDSILGAFQGCAVCLPSLG